MRSALLALLALTALLAALCACAQPDQDDAPPPPEGVAVGYPGDIEIATDPRVVFHEDFEAAAIDEVVNRWTEASNEGGSVLSLSDDAPPASSGRRSLEMTSRLGENTGGHLYRVLDEGLDLAFARFYVKFPEDVGYIHHFVTLGGYNPATRWPQGGAGERPEGTDRITVGIEPFGGWGDHQAPGIWNFYCYWHEMKISADGRYWGNALTPPDPAVAPRGRWQCVEVGVLLNSAPESRDGELALWLDGEPVLHIHQGAPRGPWSGMGFQVVENGGEPFEGFSWRTSVDLKINFLWLMLYVTEENVRRNGVEEPPATNHVLFDDIVVARSYIGPIAQP